MYLPGDFGQFAGRERITSHGHDDLVLEVNVHTVVVDEAVHESADAAMPFGRGRREKQVRQLGLHDARFGVVVLEGGQESALAGLDARQEAREEALFLVGGVESAGGGEEMEGIRDGLDGLGSGIIEGGGRASERLQTLFDTPVTSQQEAERIAGVSRRSQERAQGDHILKMRREGLEVQ